MKITKKQTIGENLLYVMVWSAIILVPVLNSLMMSELHVSWENVLIAWRKIAPYLIIFIVHNSVIAPRFMLKHKYWKYLITNLTLIIGTFWFVDFYEQHITDSLLFSDLSEDQFIEHRKASFTDLEMYWNVILGFFMSGANTGIKLMYQSIRDEQQMEELKQQNMQAEMDYLKYQINPHFLFNTLNAGAQLAMMEGADRTYEYVQNVAEFFRYNVKKSSDIVTVREELELVDHYIYILNVRFSGDIHYGKEIEEDLLDSCMPSMILQPIVENSVNHGIREMNGEGKIRLKVYHVDGDTLGISIRDNGIGMDPDTIEKVLGGNYHEEQSGGGSNGIAMGNVIARLKLFTQNEDVMTILSDGKDQGTEVILYLPIKEREKTDV